GLWLMARMLGGDRRVALVASLGVVLLPATAWEAQNSQTHSVLALTMAVWAMLAAVRAERRGGLADYALLGVALGLGLLAKGTFAFLGLGIVAALALRGAGLARIAVALAVMAAVIARPAVWAIRNWGLTTVDTYKFKMEDEGGVLTALEGVAALGQAVGAGAGLAVAAALVVVLTRRAEGPAGPDARLVEWSLGLGLATVAVAVLAAGGTEVKERWLQPLTILLPLVLACRLAPRLAPPVLKVFAGLAAVLALALLIGVGANMRLGGKNPPYQAGPFAAAAAGLPGEILAADFYLAGNLRLARPDLAVKVPKMRLMPVAPAPVAAVWWARDDAARAMPGDLVALLAAEGLVAGAATVDALPYPPPHEARVFHLHTAPLADADN
ncbi:MAG: glycosyltransferase family 39 protein, partial [Pseudomonadota bacterium]